VFIDVKTVIISKEVYASFEVVIEIIFWSILFIFTIKYVSNVLFLL